MRKQLYVAVRQWSVSAVLICSAFASSFASADNSVDLALEESMRKAVFIVVDGVPADVLERVHTPNLDLISNEGG